MSDLILSLPHYHRHIAIYVVQDTRYKIQEALFNVGLPVNLITLAHLSDFPTNKCKATRQSIQSI